MLRFSDFWSNEYKKEDDTICLPPPLPETKKDSSDFDMTEFEVLEEKINDLQKDNIELMGHLVKMQNSFEDTLNKLNNHIDNLELKIEDLTTIVKKDIDKEEDLSSTKLQLQNANNYIQDLLKMILGKFADRVAEPSPKISPETEAYIRRKNGGYPKLP